MSPTAPAGPWDGALIDYNGRAERMGWLPSAPQLETNPLNVAKQADTAGKKAKDYVARSRKWRSPSPSRASATGCRGR
jgi:nitrate reductase alpha subunit